MEVILLEKIHNLGNLGDSVTVKPGYARNFLIPQGKATRATKENIATFESMRAELEAKAKDSLTVAEARAAKLADLTVTISANAGAEGKLYGSVGALEVAEAVTAAGVALEKREVRLPEGHPLRHVGEFEIAAHLHSDVNATFTVKIEALASVDEE